MTLQEKRELLANLKSIRDNKQKEFDLKTKDLSAVTEKKNLETAKTALQTVKDDLDKLTTDVDALETEINDEEESIKSAAEGLRRNKGIEVNKGERKYIDSEDAVKDFTDLLMKGLSAEQNVKSWKDHLATKGVTNPDAFLPAAVITEITNSLRNVGDIYATFDDTGLEPYDGALDVADGDSSRAHGHKDGDTKFNEDITIKNKVIRSDFVPKYIKLSRKVVREQKDTGALLKYLSKEMPQKVVSEMERAGIIGDGRATDAKGKVTSFEAITSADEKYCASVTQTSNPYEDMVDLISAVDVEGPIHMVTSKVYLNTLKKAKDGDGRYMFATGNVAEQLGLAAIHTPAWMKNATEAVAVVYADKTYKLSGDVLLEHFEGFLMEYNQNEFLTEAYKGGGLTIPGSAAKLVAAQEV
jgi:HK97 family phage major capsid protein